MGRSKLGKVGPRAYTRASDTESPVAGHRGQIPVLEPSDATTARSAIGNTRRWKRSIIVSLSAQSGVERKFGELESCFLVRMLDCAVQQFNTLLRRFDP